MATETEQHVALPKLYGAPAYARPPRPVPPPAPRVDVDDLPLEAERSDEDRLLAAGLHPAGQGADGAASAGRAPGATGGAPAGRYLGPRSAAAGGLTADGVAPDGEPALQPRPFRLRALASRLLGGR
ncbi:MAG TPA: hypothetical protein VF763_11815 [Candidatus Limnocylindrales bacterium]